MELLSPAGNLEKLKYAYLYGADAAYIGIRDFSLRQKAGNFRDREYLHLKEIKGGRKLYGALNIFFHQPDLRRLEENLDYLALYPLDGFIISDLGILKLLRDRFPDIPIHLSTQANCVNRRAAEVYRDLGFSRIILGRETPLDEIAAIKAALPDLELECFVHGAMCLAYSGRCFLSRYLADRSANQGNCSHSCRWNYRLLAASGDAAETAKTAAPPEPEAPPEEAGLVLEESQRPGEYFPLETGEGFTTILSSKDLCMIDHLKELKEAGIDSIKIEGRMKSLYYTAVITRAYRKHLDALENPGETSGGPTPEDLAFYREELFKVSHREFSTGFFFGKEEIEAPTAKSYLRSHIFLGTLGPRQSPGGSGSPDSPGGPGDPGVYALDLKNKIFSGEELEFIGPDILSLKTRDYLIRDEAGNPADQGDHGKNFTLETSLPLKEGYIIRRGLHPGE